MCQDWFVLAEDLHGYIKSPSLSTCRVALDSTFQTTATPTSPKVSRSLGHSFHLVPPTVWISNFHFIYTPRCKNQSFAQLLINPTRIAVRYLKNMMIVRVLHLHTRINSDYWGRLNVCSELNSLHGFIRTGTWLNLKKLQTLGKMVNN